MSPIVSSSFRHSFAALTAIHVTHRDKVVKPSGKEVELSFVAIDSQACTGCGLCVQPCAPDAIQHVPRRDIPIHIVKTSSTS